MVATSGAQLLPQDAVASLRELLLPLTTILTPNLPEARLLLQNAGLEAPAIHNVDDLKLLARQVKRLGPKYVLLKGGHLPLNKARHVPDEHDPVKHFVVDVLCGEESIEVIKGDYFESKHTHGTGCSLACRWKKTSSTRSRKI